MGSCGMYSFLRVTGLQRRQCSGILRDMEVRRYDQKARDAWGGLAGGGSQKDMSPSILQATLHATPLHYYIPRPPFWGVYK